MLDRKISKKEIKQFQDMIWQFYKLNKRVFDWRNIDDPYKVLVSEIMLQQTQTQRVEKKFAQFIEILPNFAKLAAAEFKDVLMVWQGLGYNRRAQALHKTAKIVIRDYDGVLPDCPETLQKFPGIGPYTAGSICAFAFNMPTVFVETNIRAVFIHEFFLEEEKVNDKLLMPLVEKTVDKYRPREWYYALMDYGVNLKKLYKNPSRKSAHYTKQSAFEGSDRQMRSMVLKFVLQKKQCAHDNILLHINKDIKRVEKIIQDLVAENFLIKIDGRYTIV